MESVCLLTGIFRHTTSKWIHFTVNHYSWTYYQVHQVHYDHCLAANGAYDNQSD